MIVTACRQVTFSGLLKHSDIIQNVTTLGDIGLRVFGVELDVQQLRNTNCKLISTTPPITDHVLASNDVSRTNTSTRKDGNAVSITRVCFHEAASTIKVTCHESGLTARPDNHYFLPRTNSLRNLTLKAFPIPSIALSVLRRRSHPLQQPRLSPDPLPRIPTHPHRDHLARTRSRSPQRARGSLPITPGLAGSTTPIILSAICLDGLTLLLLNMPVPFISSGRLSENPDMTLDPHPQRVARSPNRSFCEHQTVDLTYRSFRYLSVQRLRCGYTARGWVSATGHVHHA